MRYFITTDTHFFHKNMIPYCGRPEGFEFLIQKGLKVVKPEDILIHLGDVCIGQDEKAHNMFIQPLPGKKWLIRGNHDKKSDTWYLEHGWDFVGVSLQLSKFGKQIKMTHRPAPNGDYDINLHGHFHNNLPRLQERKWVTDDEEERNKVYLNNLSSKHKLLALEYTNYQPVRLRTIVEGM